MENIPTVKFSTGEVIFKEGDPSNSVYLIINGKVEISRQRSKKKFILATQRKNTIFGEMALIDGLNRSATVIALEETFCYKCSAFGILQEIKKIDKEVYKAMQNFAAIIRKNNDLKLSDNKNRNIFDNKEIMMDENLKEPYLTKEEVSQNTSLNAKVEQLTPFIKSMYRVLFNIAYNG